MATLPFDIANDIVVKSSFATWWLPFHVNQGVNEPKYNITSSRLYLKVNPIT